MHWGRVARGVHFRRPGWLLSVVLLTLAVSWPGALRTDTGAVADQGTVSVVQHADARVECGPDGPARCHHGGDHRAAGRLHPSGAWHEDTAAGYPAAGRTSVADQPSPTARPPSRPSLAELQVWRR